MKYDFNIVGIGYILDGGSMLIETNKETFFKIQNSKSKTGTIEQSTATKGHYVECENQDEIAVVLELMVRFYRDGQFYSPFIKLLKANHKLSKKVREKLFFEFVENADGNLLQYPCDAKEVDAFMQTYLTNKMK